MGMIFGNTIGRVLSSFVSVHPHEVSPLLHSSSCFFFILSAYFVLLPLRDEGAISLGLSSMAGLFVGSLALTLLAAPLSSSLFFSFSKSQALFFIHRFFGASLVAFFLLWHFSSSAIPAFNTTTQVTVSTSNPHLDVPQSDSGSWADHGWFYVSVRICFFLWVALLNLITISSTWARVIDVMDTDSGSRLFGFIGAGATFGQLFGSLFATGMAWLGSYLLLFAALLMELAAQASLGIKNNTSELPEELSPIRKADSDEANKSEEQTEASSKVLSQKSPASREKPQLSAVLDGFWLILSSTYLLYVALFLWLSAVVSSIFYFQKMTVIAMTVSSSLGRRRLFAQINSLIAVFILAGQLTLTGRILTIAGVTTAICSTPVVAFSNLIALAAWPNWITVAICEIFRKVVTYVVTRPGRELLFTVVSEEEKYKAKMCIDVIVQRLGDASAAGLYKLLFSTIHGRTSTVSIYALPVCLIWVVTAFHLGRRQAQLAKFQNL